MPRRVPRRRLAAETGERSLRGEVPRALSGFVCCETIRVADRPRQGATVPIYVKERRSSAYQLAKRFVV